MLARLLAVVSLVLVMPAGGWAQTVAAFYAGRSLDVVVGFPPGGNYDLFARPTARNLGRFIPGTPTLIIKYMPGAGSLVASSYVANVAAKDGSVLGVISPTAPLDAKLNPAGAKFAPAALTWVGRIAPQPFAAIVWHTSPVRTIEQARSLPVTFGGSGAGSGTVTYPVVANAVIGTKFKMVTGYKGTADAFLAMERGEIEAHATGVELIRTSRPEWLRDGKVHLLMQFMLSRHPSLPDVPAVIEHARDAEQVAILKGVFAAAEIGRSLITTPGVPAERLTALRRAFDAMVRDPEFVADLQKSSMDVLPMAGEKVQALVTEIDAMPAALLDKIRAAIGN